MATGARAPRAPGVEKMARRRRPAQWDRPRADKREARTAVWRQAPPARPGPRTATRDGQPVMCRRQGVSRGPGWSAGGAIWMGALWQKNGRAWWRGKRRPFPQPEPVRARPPSGPPPRSPRPAEACAPVGGARRGKGAPGGQGRRPRTRAGVRRTGRRGPPLRQGSQPPRRPCARKSPRQIQVASTETLCGRPGWACAPGERGRAATAKRRRADRGTGPRKPRLTPPGSPQARPRQDRRRRRPKWRPPHRSARGGGEAERRGRARGGRAACPRRRRRRWGRRRQEKRRGRSWRLAGRAGHRGPRDGGGGRQAREPAGTKVSHGSSRRPRRKRKRRRGQVGGRPRAAETSRTRGTRRLAGTGRQERGSTAAGRPPRPPRTPRYGAGGHKMAGSRRAGREGTARPHRRRCAERLQGPSHGRRQRRRPPAWRPPREGEEWPRAALRRVETEAPGGQRGVTKGEPAGSSAQPRPCRERPGASGTEAGDGGGTVGPGGGGERAAVASQRP